MREPEPPRRMRGKKTMAERLRGPDEIRTGYMQHRWWYDYNGYGGKINKNWLHDDFKALNPLVSGQYSERWWPEQVPLPPHLKERLRKRLMALCVADRRRLARALGIPLSLENRPLL